MFKNSHDQNHLFKNFSMIQHHIPNKNFPWSNITYPTKIFHVQKISCPTKIFPWPKISCLTKIFRNQSSMTNKKICHHKIFHTHTHKILPCSWNQTYTCQQIFRTHHVFVRSSLYNKFSITTVPLKVKPNSFNNTTYYMHCQDSMGHQHCLS